MNNLYALPGATRGKLPYQRIAKAVYAYHNAAQERCAQN
jgi:hypothetical protein